VPAVVNSQARIEFDSNRYSTPPQFVRRPVTIRANHNEIRVLHEGRMVVRPNLYPDAIADFTEAIRLEPNNAKYLNNRGRAFFELKQYDRAIADHDAALRIDPRFAVSYFNRGLAREATGDRDAAIADFRTSVELEPSNLTYRIQLLSFWKRLGTKRPDPPTGL